MNGLTSVMSYRLWRQSRESLEPSSKNEETTLDQKINIDSQKETKLDLNNDPLKDKEWHDIPLHDDEQKKPISFFERYSMCNIL